MSRRPGTRSDLSFIPASPASASGTDSTSNMAPSTRSSDLKGKSSMSPQFQCLVDCADFCRKTVFNNGFWLTSAGQDKQKMLLASDAGHFSMIRALHLADLITEMNGFCGFMSILSSMRYCLGPPSEFTQLYLALGLIPLGLFFDFMDGRVARWRGKSSLMGQELDSLADLISFGAAPAVAAFALGLRSHIDTLCLAFFVLCGLTRLARFNVTASSIPHDASGKAAYFEGCPIPTSLGLVAGMAVSIALGRVGAQPTSTWARTVHEAVGEDLKVSESLALRGVVGGVYGAETAWEWHPIAAVFVVWGCLLVSRTIHIPKP